MKRLLVLAVVAFPLLAFAQDTAPSAGQPAWLTLLLALLPILIPAVLAIHPLLKLAAYLHARALDSGRSAAAKLALLAVESLSKSVDHFLESTGGDYADLADPSKRAAALKHIEDQAKAGALPAVTDALQTLGSSWFTGAASQALDNAAAKAIPAAVVPAVAAIAKAAAPTPPPAPVAAPALVPASP